MSQPEVRTIPVDPWREARAPWIPPPGSRAERVTAQQFQKPRLWQFVIRAEDRALIAQLAGEVLAEEPAISPFAFGGRVLERIRARGAAARGAAERARLHDLDGILSAQLATLLDLYERARALPTEEVR